MNTKSATKLAQVVAFQSGKTITHEDAATKAKAADKARWVSECRAQVVKDEEAFREAREDLILSSESLVAALAGTNEFRETFGYEVPKYVPIHRCPGCGQATDLSMCSRCSAAGVSK